MTYIMNTYRPILDPSKLRKVIKFKKSHTKNLNE